MGKTCFVAMAIGDQRFDEITITSAELKSRYNNLIKEAILKSRPDLEIVRADEVAAPGAITTDIYNRLMHSDYVLFDVTFPNPNVFYELGIRTACRPGTILIREKNGPKVPFDIAGLRQIYYEDTTGGLKALANDLQKQFDWFDAHPRFPDNAFLELAKLTNYQFPDYANKASEEEVTIDAMLEFMKVPDLLPLLSKVMRGETFDEHAFAEVAKHPDVFKKMMLMAMRKPRS